MMPESDVTPSSFRLRWDVFLSFRGTDTRHTFTMNLYHALHARGVRVFRDDDGLERGDEIQKKLLEAVEDSAASVVVLSPDYASSHWCLEELAKICECGRLILPVFYWVDPSHVRKQKDPFEESFVSHSKRFSKETVQDWRNAMKKVGGIAGYVLDHKSDKDKSDKLIQVLVQTLMKQLRNTPLNVAPYAVGLDDRVEDLKNKLDVKSNDVRVLGLYGMGGVGKTTLAKSLFNSLVVHNFERRSFIPNVRSQASKHNGLVSLQSTIRSDLGGGKKEDLINDVNDGISAIRKIVQTNRVLLVLDDVDDTEQLNFLMGKREWFYKGSRVVITTRDREVLHESYVDVHYEVKELEFSPAMELFCYHAMRRKEPAEGFLDLSNQIVEKTGGLPLALEVFGSFLFDKRTMREWKDAVEKLKKIRPACLQDVLKISFDALDEQEQCVFLDIACLFVQLEMKRSDVVDVLNGCEFRGEIAVTVLTARCLIKIIKDGEVWMHDQVRDMGRQIVHAESLADPGLRSRLWDRDEIFTVLKTMKGTRNVQGIVLDCVKRRMFTPRDSSRDEIAWENFRRNPSCKSALEYIKEKCKKYMLDRQEKAKEVIFQPKHFEPMVSLRLLQINYLRLEGDFRCLPPGLKWLQWKQCPLRYMPSSYDPLELAVMDLSESQIEMVWSENKVAKHLMVLNLSSCHRLTATPDLTGYQSLEKFILEECSHLTRIHESLGNLSSLVHLNLNFCHKLIELPGDVSGLKHLEDLILSNCWTLKALPEDLSCMVSLRQLLLDNTAISELPQSIFHLTKLEKLSANVCRYLKRLPTCIGKLCSLQELSLNHTAIEELPDSVGSLEKLEMLSLMGCKSLSVIPNSIGKLVSLTQLFLDVSGIKELPASIGSLSYLRKLSVQGCTSIDKLPVSIEALVSIAELKLEETTISILPDQIAGMKMLEKLEMGKCQLLRFLPVSFGCLSALISLDMHEANIIELPESIGMLENLIRLRLDMCKQLQRLPESIGNLKSLRGLMMKETALTHLPDSFGMLTSLVELDMERRSYLNGAENMSTGVIIPDKQQEPNSEAILSSLCNLTLLEKLNAHGWGIDGNIPDEFEKLSLLETLRLGHNNICSLPASMMGLSYLKKLLLSDCRELMFLPPLPSSLEELNLANCIAVQYIHDISNLERLEELNLTNCEKVVDIPGLEHLKSLRRLYMSGCIECSLVVKRRFSKVLLKKLEILIMPGSRVPDWFTAEPVVFSKRRNRELKGIICFGVLSFNNIPENQRERLQLEDVQGKIFNLTDNVFSKTFRLLGVPRTNEDHMFLHRFGVNSPLVFQLKDKYTLHLQRRDPPRLKGVELNNCRIHLVFEGDDDYEGDEGSLDESQYSVSQKLAKFFNFAADGPCV